MDNHSEAIEDYLKAIYEIQQEEGRAKTTILANRLGVSAGSVTEMVKRLSKKSPRLVTHTSHKGVTLTPEGQKVALKVIRRHRLLESFLHQVLGFSWDAIHPEADRLEHYASDRLIDAMAEYMDNPAFDPHGEPIPEKNGKLDDSRHTALAELPIDCPARIDRVVHRDAELLRYLAKNRIQPGSVITVRDRAPLSGPITVQTGIKKNRSTIAVACEVAGTIYVTPLPHENTP